MYYQTSPDDKMPLMLLVAAVLHVVLILGVSFKPPSLPKFKKGLEVTLIRNPTPKAPNKAEFRAQENQIGGGTSNKKGKLAAPPPPPARVQEASPGTHLAANSPPPAPEPKNKPVLQQEKKSVKKIVPLVEPKPSQPVQPEQSPASPAVLTPELLRQQIADFSVDYLRTQEQNATRKRILYVNSVTAHKYKAAEYEHAWQDKIERIGNLNYPDEARRKSLSGSLLLSVGIKQDGSVYSIQIRHSSGHAVLDEAAQRIVRLAAPFAAFPEELKKEADVLVITRTWRFYTDAHIETDP